MRQLRFVKQGDDPDHAILETADAGEQFLLLVDTALREAFRSDLPRLHASAPEPAARISPRDIQMRVRAGESPRELAEANEITLERVMRFAAPVLAERTRIADEARRGRARRSTTEGQTVDFGDAVDERFRAHGIDPAAVRWDARRREDGHWIVSAGWLGGDAERVAEWSFQLGPRSLAPLDDTAADLLSDRPIHPVTPAPLAPVVLAFPTMPDAPTGPLTGARTAGDEVFDQEAHSEADGEASSDAGYHAPPLPLRLPDHGDGGTAPMPRLTNLGVAHRDDETDDRRSERARIPSWDDIMLGVRRKGD